MSKQLSPYRSLLAKIIADAIHNDTCLGDISYDLNTPGLHELSIKFHSTSVPSISINDYLKRIVQYTVSSDEVIIIAYLYISSIQRCILNFPVNQLTIHRLLITAIMVLSKYHDDIYYNNAFYARIGGVSTKEINELEILFLKLTQFQLGCDEETYYAFLHELLANNPNLDKAYKTYSDSISTPTFDSKSKPLIGVTPEQKPKINLSSFDEQNCKCDYCTCDYCNYFKQQKTPIYIQPTNVYTNKRPMTA